MSEHSKLCSWKPPITYLCEQGFSAFANLKSKYRNRLDPEDDNQVALTAEKPSFQTILD